jgi:hypothetical protein
MFDLFQYVDYRLFLRDWLAAVRKRRGFFFSPIRHPGGVGVARHLKMVIDGQRI